MANSLNTNLEGKRIRLKKEEFKPPYDTMPATVTGGFGASPDTMGSALFVRFDNGVEARVEGYDVLEIVE